MKIEDKTMPAVSFDAFADENGLVMEIRERPSSIGLGHGRRYYARFKDAEVMDRGCLVGAHGNGATKEEAIADYARRLRGERIAIRAYRDDRANIQCPNEWSDYS